MQPIEPLPLFFPPSPPPLGRPIGRAVAGNQFPAPPELAGFVNDPFYPPLGTRLATRTLNDRLRARVESYRAAKSALLAELREQLDRVRSAEPATRTSELEAFARKQTPRIVELENTAEQLRRDLVSADNHWSAVRQWRLGEKDRRGFSPFEIAIVMRGYAYYHASMLPAQRRLLREIFLELANAADSTANATAAQPYLFFPPEPARVLLPDDLPADVAANVAAYQTKKSKLKKELYDAVYEQDSIAFSFLRNPIKALAAKQAGPLAELETLAEEIRRGLANVAEPQSITERSPLPPSLQKRVDALLAGYTALQQDCGARIEAILEEAKGLPIQTNYRFDPDGLKYVVVPTRGNRSGVQPDTLQQINAVRARFGEVAEDYGRRAAELLNEREALRGEIGRALGSAKGNAVDTALAAASRVASAKATEDSYREYRIAVFQPGLSPEQRRLLFDGVMEQLRLPLPPGERQPVYRAASW